MDSSKWSFIFPGQGSQEVGMGLFIHETASNQVFKETFQEAEDILKLPIKKWALLGPAEELNLTQNTQPILLTHSMACVRWLKNELKITPAAVAGHSIGEYAALVTANVISFSDALKAVRLRGTAMQEAVPVGQGGMTAALGLTIEQILFLCSWVEKESGFHPISPANFNCDGQIVLSGSLKALNWLKDHFNPDIFTSNGLPEAKRAKFIPLTVSAPFHCAMMRPAEEKMRHFFSDITFNNSIIPVIQNYNALATTDAKEIKENLIKQVSGSVKWTQSIQEFNKMGFTKFIEAGHGTVLKGLSKKINPENIVFNMNSMADIEAIKTEAAR